VIAGWKVWQRPAVHHQDHPVIGAADEASGCIEQPVHNAAAVAPPPVGAIR